MITDISEFSFGFALTNELIDVFDLAVHGAPSFPTQVQEGQKGGGYDVKLPGLPLFIQFKRSVILRRYSALDASYFGLPYYRFGITASSHSQQHQLLLDLEEKENVVYYAAPIFCKSHELDRFFVSKSVRHNSIFLKPSTIGAIGDTKPHTISFTSSGPAIYRSEPEFLNRDEFLLPQTQKIESVAIGDSPTTSRMLTEQLVDIYTSRRGYIDDNVRQTLRNPREHIDPMQHLSYLARNLFGCELLYASSSDAS